MAGVTHAGPSSMAGVIYPGLQVYGWVHTSRAPGLRLVGLKRDPRFMAGGLISGARGLRLGEVYLHPGLQVYGWGHTSGALGLRLGDPHPGPQVYGWGIIYIQYVTPPRVYL